MFFTDSTYLGIDPTAGRKPLTYAALDDQLRLTSLGEGTLDEVLAILGGQSQAIAAVCAPRRPSQRLMGRPQVRDTLSPPPHPGRYVDFRVAEYLLRQHNISCYQTPAEEKDCPNWMQVGFQLYSRLEKMGYHAFPARGHALQWMEVYPHACYSALLGQVPLPKNSLEGRIQRQLALCQLHLNLPDPVEVLKKITTRSLLEGTWPVEKLYSQCALDAIVAAYTAWQSANHPDQITALGDDSEGLVILPVGELKRRY